MVVHVEPVGMCIYTRKPNVSRRSRRRLSDESSGSRAVRFDWHRRGLSSLGSAGGADYFWVPCYRYPILAKAPILVVVDCVGCFIRYNRKPTGRTSCSGMRLVGTGAKEC